MEYTIIDLDFDIPKFHILITEISRKVFTYLKGISNKVTNRMNYTESMV